MVIRYSKLFAAYALRKVRASIFEFRIYNIASAGPAQSRKLCQLFLGHDTRWGFEMASRENLTIPLGYNKLYLMFWGQKSETKEGAH